MLVKIGSFGTKIQIFSRFNYQKLALNFVAKSLNESSKSSPNLGFLRGFLKMLISIWQKDSSYPSCYSDHQHVRKLMFFKRNKSWIIQNILVLKVLKWKWKFFFWLPYFWLLQLKLLKVEDTANVDFPKTGWITTKITAS